MPSFDAGRMLADIKTLSSDEFEGRAPGSKGEELTVKFLEDQFKKIGLQPGNTDGTFVQSLPLVGITASNTRPLTVSGHGKKATFKWRDDLVAWTKRVTDTSVARQLRADLRRLRRHRARVQVGRLQGRRHQRQDDSSCWSTTPDPQRFGS
jgi:hypothetical protein